DGDDGKQNPLGKFTNTEARYGAAEEPPQQKQDRWQAEQKALIGTAVGENREAKREKQRVAGARLAQNSCQRAKQQGAARGSDSAAQVAVDPVAGEAELEPYHDAAEHRPARR